MEGAPALVVPSVDEEGGKFTQIGALARGGLFIAGDQGSHYKVLIALNYLLFPQRRTVTMVLQTITYIERRKAAPIRWRRVSYPAWILRDSK